MVFDKHWFKRYKLPLLLLVNTAYGKRFFCIDTDKSSVGKNWIINITPNSITWRDSKNKGVVSTEFRTHDKFAKRLYFSLLPLWSLFHSWDSLVNRLRMPLLNVGFDSLTAFPAAGANSPVDGYVGFGSADIAFSSVRAQAGNTAAVSDTANNLPWLGASTTTNQFATTFLAIFLFDTSAITASPPVITATLSIFGSASRLTGLGDATNHIIACNPAATNNLVNGDYNTMTYTAQSDTNFNSAAWSEVAYNDFPFNSTGLGNISKTGISKFAMCFNWHLNNSFTGVWASGAITRSGCTFADQTGTTSDPKLVVTYGVGVGSGFSNATLNLLGFKL